MKNFITLALLSALLTSPAMGEDAYVLEEALELSANQVRFSLAGAGSITVRACKACAPKTYPLATETVLLANGESIDLNRLAELSRRGGEMYVFYDTQTGVITRLRLQNRNEKSVRL